MTFNWSMRGYEGIKTKIEWNVSVPSLNQTTSRNDEEGICSPFFSTREVPNSQWQLMLYDDITKLRLKAYHHHLTGQYQPLANSFLVIISILNKRRHWMQQQLIISQPNMFRVEFSFTKEAIKKYECQQEDGSLTFYLTIHSNVKIDERDYEINCINDLSSDFERLYENMASSDVIFNVGGREFPAHKLILATRSKVFADMLKHLTKEQLTNQIVIEDIEPEAFEHLLRFIYTGRMSLAINMPKMATALLIAADKYQVGGLKIGCETYLLSYMTPDNCVDILARGDLKDTVNAAENLRKAAKFFMQQTEKVMATVKWKELEKENPALLKDIQRFVINPEIFLMNEDGNVVF